MLPDVAAENRRALHGGGVHQRVVLVRGAGNRQFAVLADNQPCPAGAELFDARVLEGGFEGVKAAKGGVDGFQQLALRRAAAVRAHHVPVEVVVVVAAAVVAHCCRVFADVGEDGFQRFTRQRAVLDGSGEVVEIGLVVAAVVDFHRGFVDDRLQCVCGVGQGGEGVVCHGGVLRVCGAAIIGARTRVFKFFCLFFV